MQATTVLSLRALANKIHGPLPLSKRESQQLLSLLTSSFQHQLDHYHPVQETELKSLGIQQRTALCLHSTVGTANQPSLSSRASASGHLLSILDHPLLSKKPRSASFSKRQTSRLEKTSGIGASLNLLPWLEEKFADGTISIVDVARCLSSISGKSFAEIPTEAQQQWLKGLGAASKIISWLRVGGQISETDLLQNKVVCSQLTKLLIIEERKDLIWSFIKETTPNNIVRYALSTETRLRGVEAAMKTFNKLLIAFPSLASSNYAWPIVENLVRKPQNVVREVYDQFARNISSSKIASLYEAVLPLYHPERPSTEKTLLFVQRYASSLDIVQHAFTKSERRILVHTVLKLASILLEREEHMDAQMVLAFAQNHFAEELGIQVPNGPKVDTISPQPSEAELENVQRIGLLAL